MDIMKWYDGRRVLFFGDDRGRMCCDICDLQHPHYPWKCQIYYTPEKIRERYIETDRCAACGLVHCQSEECNSEHIRFQNGGKICKRCGAWNHHLFWTCDGYPHPGSQFKTSNKAVHSYMAAMQHDIKNNSAELDIIEDNSESLVINQNNTDKYQIKKLLQEKEDLVRELKVKDEFYIKHEWKIKQLDIILQENDDFHKEKHRAKEQNKIVSEQNKIDSELISFLEGETYSLDLKIQNLENNLKNKSDHIKRPNDHHHKVVEEFQSKISELESQLLLQEKHSSDHKEKYDTYCKIIERYNRKYEEIEENLKKIQRKKEENMKERYKKSLEFYREKIKQNYKAQREFMEKYDIESNRFMDLISIIFPKAKIDSDLDNLSFINVLESKLRDTGCESEACQKKMQETVKSRNTEISILKENLSQIESKMTVNKKELLDRQENLRNAQAYVESLMYERIHNNEIINQKNKTIESLQLQFKTSQDKIHTEENILIHNVTSQDTIHEKENIRLHKSNLNVSINDIKREEK